MVYSELQAITYYIAVVLYSCAESTDFTLHMVLSVSWILLMGVSTNSPQPQSAVLEGDPTVQRQEPIQAETPT